MTHFDPTRLEPKNGDFARYIEELNKGAIDHLKVAQLSESEMAKATQALGDSLWQSNQRLDTAKAMDPHLQRRETLHERSKAQGQRQMAKALTPLCIFAGFGCFTLGGILGDEFFIFLGMGIFVFGMFSSAILGRKRK